MKINPVFAFLFVLVLWIANWYLYLIYDATKAGSIGDMFGVTNTLFSGLAFVALVVSIRMQNEELKLQRIELEANRKEMKESREAQQLTAKQLEQQTLFHYVTLKYEALNVIQKNLPDRIEKLRLKLANEFVESVKDNADYFIVTDPHSRVLDNKKVEIEMKKYWTSNVEYLNLIRIEEDLMSQKKELDDFMCLKNPDILLEKLIES
jgi:hypothetical protein